MYICIIYELSINERYSFQKKPMTTGIIKKKKTRQLYFGTIWLFHANTVLAGSIILFAGD